MSKIPDECEEIFPGKDEGMMIIYYAWENLQHSNNETPNTMETNTSTYYTPTHKNSSHDLLKK